MEILLLALNVVSLFFGIALAFVMYQIIRLVLTHFRESLPEKEKRKYMILRMSDRTVAILCVCCFLALVLQTVELVETYAPDGFIESLAAFFAVIPAGFLLGMLIGFLAFTAFKLLALLRSVAR